MLNPKDKNVILGDVKRTYPESDYFKSEAGQLTLLTLLTRLNQHPSSVGYIQGMNNIAGCLLYHSDSVIAFELILRALNDYHLKEVHMTSLPGVYSHSAAIQNLIR